MKTKTELEQKAQELRHRVIDLELLGCARTRKQEEELTQLAAGYNAIMYALGCTKNCRALI